MYLYPYINTFCKSMVEAWLTWKMQRDRSTWRGSHRLVLFLRKVLSHTSVKPVRQLRANSSLMRMIHVMQWFHNVIRLLSDHKMKRRASSAVHMDHFHTPCCTWIWYLLKATSIRCVNMIHCLCIIQTCLSLSITGGDAPMAVFAIEELGKHISILGKREETP